MNETTEHGDPARLARRLAGWRDRFAGVDLYRVAAGSHGLRLHLADEQHTSLLLVALPAASLAFAAAGRLPEAVHRALDPAGDHPLTRLLDGGRLIGCGALAGDRIACLQLAAADGRRFYLLHQMFGAPGNTALLDEAAVLHWARRRPPHRLLAAVPPPETWRHGEAADEDDEDDEEGLRLLILALVRRLDGELRAELNRRAKAARRLRDNLRRDLDNAEQGDLYRRQAEALAAHLHLVEAGADHIDVADPRDGSPLVIGLDPALPAAANLEAWFRRARKAERGRRVIAERLEDAENRAAAVQRMLAEVAGFEPEDPIPAEAGLAWLTDLQRWRADHPAAATAPGRGRRTAADEPARPFRRYRIDGRWEVWIGRNNRENDELTHRASHGRDIWLHAQGVPGSHVILRTGGRPDQVPASVLEKAAALAALNSKARHAGLVPVIHTERRYVRKPRKAPAGTAVTLRDKSVFVEPGVAPGVEPR